MTRPVALLKPKYLRQRTSSATAVWPAIRALALAQCSARVVAFCPDNEKAFGGIRVGHAVVGGFLSPCTPRSTCVTGRNDICSSFFEFNRLRGKLFDGQSTLSMSDGPFLAGQTVTIVGVGRSGILSL